MGSGFCLTPVFYFIVLRCFFIKKLLVIFPIVFIMSISFISYAEEIPSNIFVPPQPVITEYYIQLYAADDEEWFYVSFTKKISLEYILSTSTLKTKNNYIDDMLSYQVYYYNTITKKWYLSFVSNEIIIFHITDLYSYNYVLGNVPLYNEDGSIFEYNTLPPPNLDGFLTSIFSFLSVLYSSIINNVLGLFCVTISFTGISFYILNKIVRR